MARSMFALAGVALLGLATGCTMCAGPYDYCGPTFTGGDCQQCMPTGRAGSILSPSAAVGYEAELEPGMMVPVPDAQMAGPTEGIEQLLEAVVTGKPLARTASAPRRLP